MNHDIEITQLDLVAGGNIIRQGDHFSLSFTPRDENGEVVELTGKDIYAVFYDKDDIRYEGAATYVSSDAVIRVAVTENIGHGTMWIEFTATDPNDAAYKKKFPARENNARISITPSTDDLSFVGVKSITVEQLRNEQAVAQQEFEADVLPRVQTVESQQAQLAADYEAAAGALTEDSEVILARRGEPTLGAFNDKVTAQLADTSAETGYGIVRGGLVSEKTIPDMTVSVGELVAYSSDGKRFYLPQTSVPISSSSPTLTRRDLLYINSVGEIKVIEGVPSLQGIPPNAPVNSIPLAIVSIKQGAVSITKNQILDKRIFRLSVNELQNETQNIKANNAISNRASEGVISTMMDYAQSYVKNRGLFDYGSNDAFRSGSIYTNAAGNFEMTCSTFCHLMVKGIPFEKSKYAGLPENIQDINFNNDYEVTPEFVTFRWAEWAYKNGYLFKPKSDYSNLKPGDMLMMRFRKPENQLVNRDMAFELIEHSAMFVEQRKTGLMVYEQGSDDGAVFRTYTPDLLVNHFELAYVIRMPYTGVGWKANNLLLDSGVRKDINGGYLIGTYALNKPLKNHKWYTVVVKGKLETPNTYLSFYSGDVALRSGSTDFVSDGDLHTFHFCTEDKNLSANNFRVLLASDGSVPDAERYADVEWVVLSEGYGNSINEFIDGGKSTSQKNPVNFTFENGLLGNYDTYVNGNMCQVNIRVTNPSIITDSQLINIGSLTGTTLKTTKNKPVTFFQQLSASPSYASNGTAWIATDGTYRLRFKNGTTQNVQFLEFSFDLPI